MGAWALDDNLAALLVEEVRAFYMELPVYGGPSIYHFCIGKSNEGKNQ